MNSTYYIGISIIVTIMFLVFILVQNERMGMTAGRYSNNVELMMPVDSIKPTNSTQKNILSTTNLEYLIIFDSREDFSILLKDNVLEVLNYMSINNYEVVDISKQMPKYSNYKHVIFTINDYFDLNNTIEDLILFVADGGTALLAASILPNSVYKGLYRYLGIKESRDFVGSAINEIEITSCGFLAGISEGEIFIDDGDISIQDFMLNVKLEDTTEVFMRDANTHSPLAWKAEYGNGHFIVYGGFNNALKGNRGILAALISQLKEVSIYPIANSFIMYIDGYPSPATTSVSETIRMQYAMQERDFIRDIWWRDIKNISRKYSIPYTSSLVTTNTILTTPPFSPQGGDEVISKSASEILVLGGEIGLYGYNSVPLIKTSDKKYEEDYITWDTKYNMEESLNASYEYASSLIKRDFQVYVPPNNFLDEYGREAVINALDINIISSTYFNMDDERVYSQEFTESPDGIIELPRIGGGYIIRSSNEMVYLSLNTLHGMHTHFITPEQMFYEWSNQGYTWVQMLENYEKFIISYFSRFSYIRPMTASEGALAVQKYLRTNFTQEYTNDILYIEIEEFFPGQFFYLRTHKEIVSYDNCLINKVSHNYYLVEALQPNFTINF